MKKKAVKILLVLFALGIVASCMYKFSENNKTQSDDVVVKINNQSINNSDVNRVYVQLYSNSITDVKEEKKQKKIIIENGINEVIAIEEALSNGLSIDYDAAKKNVENLKNENPEIYKLAEEQVGIEKYTEDLAKKTLINEIKEIVLKEFVSREIDDEGLYEWYCNQLSEAGKDNIVLYDDFLKNKEYVWEKWEKREKDKFFTDWIVKNREKYDIKYTSLYYDTYE